MGRHRPRADPDGSGRGRLRWIGPPQASVITAAGLGQQQDGSGDVPIVGPAPGQIAVESAGRDQGQLVGERAQGAQRRRSGPERAEIAPPALELAGDDAGVVRGSRSRSPACGAPLQVGASPRDRPRTARRSPDCRRSPAPADRRRAGHADRELGHAIGERAGAVDRVDHPDAPRARAALRSSSVSSDSQAVAGVSRQSSACRKRSTARSASVTIWPGPFSQLSCGWRK